MDVTEQLTPPQMVLEMLSKSLNYGALGRTPRPSTTEKEYITGVRDIGMHKYDRAVEHLTEAVAVATKDASSSSSNDGERELLALSKGALGYAKAASGDIAGALALYTEVLSLWEKIHGPKSSLLTCVHVDISILIEASGQPQESFNALKSFQEVLEAEKGAEDVDALGLTLSMAANLSRRQLSEDADDLFNKTIATLRKINRPELLQGLSMYYQHLQAYQKTDKAKEVKAEMTKLAQAAKQARAK